MSEKVVVKAHGKFHGNEIEADVVNPGDWFGKTWLIVIPCGFDAFFYAVEAGNVGDAIDILAEDKQYGHVIAIADADKGDYGTELNAGDEFNGVKLDHKCWVDLLGNVHNERDGLSDYNTSGQGVEYDCEEVQVFGQEGAKTPWPCVYTSSELPERYQDGISPVDYYNREWEGSDE